MIKDMIRLAVACWLLAYGMSAEAVTLRYAVVVGNNQGVDESGQRPFARLSHAEREAKELRDRLVRFSNFAPQRVELVVGASRQELRGAIERISARRQADLAELGSVDSLFAFFFTGHGLKGQLLLADGPISATDLGGQIKSVGATFTLGFFDACFSGSLDEAALAQKGIRTTPGLNLFRELPEEVLTAEGSVWFVSSGPSQMSYEDQKIGGVFTHFLIEALDSGTREGPGITLDRIWTYVRNHTVAYTTARGRRQVPQQFVASLKSTGPFYFSFPIQRSSTLVLSPSVAGRFVLSYAEGQLSEIIEKQAGGELRLAVYPGSAHLMAVNEGTVTGQKSLAFDTDRTTVVRTLSDPDLDQAIGVQRQTLWEKGFGSQTLAASMDRPAWNTFLGASYSLQFAGSGLLTPQHLSELVLRLEREHFHLGFSLGYGQRQEDFEAFDYQADALVGAARVGLGTNIGRTRWSIALGLRAGRIWQRFDDGDKRQRIWLEPATTIAWLFPIRGAFLAELSGQLGAAYLPGVGKETEYIWKLQGGLSLCLFYRF